MKNISQPVKIGIFVAFSAAVIGVFGYYAGWWRALFGSETPALPEVPETPAKTTAPQTQTRTQSATPSNDNFPLQKGSRGENVRQLQRALGIPADGSFGPQTESTLLAKTGKPIATKEDFDKLTGKTPDAAIDKKIPNKNITPAIGDDYRTRAETIHNNLNVYWLSNYERVIAALKNIPPSMRAEFAAYFEQEYNKNLVSNLRTKLSDEYYNRAISTLNA